MDSDYSYQCLRCSSRFPHSLVIDSRGCPRCHHEAPSNLQVVVPQSGALDRGYAPASSLWRFQRRLPCSYDQAVSLGEGLTPLLSAEKLGLTVDIPRLWLKDEGRNPTWSHKDRFSTLAVSMARLRGSKIVATASSGNAGASLAAYAARAGLKCVVATFAGAATPMVQQIAKYGAQIVPFSSKPDRWRFLQEGIARHNWWACSPFLAPVVGSHPVGIEGYKTLAYEIVEQSNGEVPDWCALPVCYGDALSGLWLGFKELQREGVTDRLPRLIAAEVHGSLAHALSHGGDRIHALSPGFQTLAVSVGAAQSTYQALCALRESKGLAVPIGNDGMIELQESIAEKEGVFAELASVLPVAAIAWARRREIIKRSDRVVAVLTASGLKDLDRSSNVSLPSPFGSTEEAWRYFGTGRLS
ncbi:threonine synthase [Aminobacter aganoensis]|uniref:Threonine synthase n=1 Tax=Aminobacter aganoensis TaxID=83264 RepID=A0A7X0FCQ9_9HYPH|nr:MULTISPECIES: threonine synthase [Aminobacter]MBB6357083.1 threonine synthase [Aminobacter aganoensis]